MGFILTSVLRRAAPPSPGVRGARRCPSGSLSPLPGPHGVCLRACVPRRKAGGSAQAAEQGRPSRLPGSLQTKLRRPHPEAAATGRGAPLPFSV